MKEVIVMGYRKVSAIEQIWYILRYKFRELFRKEGIDEYKKAEK